MRTVPRTIALACLLGLASLAAAADPEPTPIMTERGKMVFNDALTQELGKEWKKGKGKWEVVDGVLKGTELKEDMHGAVTRHALAAKDVVIAYSFKLDGAKNTSLSINDAKGHVCRVIIRPDGFTVQKDDHDGKDGPDKAMVLDKVETPIKPGQWHTMLVEINGKEIVATLDGKHTGLGAHEAIDVQKANLGLTVAGESVSFKDLKVWEAQPSKGWEAAKAKLLEARKAGK